MDYFPETIRSNADKRNLLSFSWKVILHRSRLPARSTRFGTLIAGTLGLSAYWSDIKRREKRDAMRALNDDTLLYTIQQISTSIPFDGQKRRENKEPSSNQTVRHSDGAEWMTKGSRLNWISKAFLSYVKALISCKRMVLSLNWSLWWRGRQVSRIKHIF